MTTQELHSSAIGAYPLQLAALYIGATMKTTVKLPISKDFAPPLVEEDKGYLAPSRG